MRLARAACDDAARRIGMSRRDFLRTSMASAATLLAIGACSDDGDGGPSAGTFDVPPESTTEPEVATTVLEGDGAPVVDVQQHLLELEGYGGSFGSSFPQGDCGDGGACFDTQHWLDLVFGRSDTTMVVLSAIPVLTDPDPLSAEVMDAARRAADELCGDGRVLVQGHAQPNVGPPEGALDAMRAEAERYDIAAWKSYTHVGQPWRLDDDLGEAFLALVEEIGPPIVCAHKGLGGDPADVGPAAAAHPGHQLRRLPLRLRDQRREGAYEPGAPGGGVDRLLESVRGAGIGPGGNVYAELGSTWRFLMGDPDQAAHLLGKLIAAPRPRQRPVGHRLDLVRLPAGPDRRVPHLRDHRRGPGALRLRAAHARGEGRHPGRQRRPPLRHRPGRRRRARPPRPTAPRCRADPPTPDVLLGPRTAAAARRVFAADHPWF